jgi:hypothetical protein
VCCSLLHPRHTATCQPPPYLHEDTVCHDGASWSLQPPHQAPAVWYLAGLRCTHAHCHLLHAYQLGERVMPLAGSAPVRNTPAPGTYGECAPSECSRYPPCRGTYAPACCASRVSTAAAAASPSGASRAHPLLAAPKQSAAACVVNGKGSCLARSVQAAGSPAGHSSAKQLNGALAELAPSLLDGKQQPCLHFGG